jgi:hypothetical protein
LLDLRLHDGQGVELFMKLRSRVMIAPALQRSELDGTTKAHRRRTRTQKRPKTQPNSRETTHTIVVPVVLFCICRLKMTQSCGSSISCGLVCSVKTKELLALSMLQRSHGSSVVGS